MEMDKEHATKRAMDWLQMTEEQAREYIDKAHCYGVYEHKRAYIEEFMGKTDWPLVRRFLKDCKGKIDGGHNIYYALEYRLFYHKDAMYVALLSPDGNFYILDR